MLSKEDSILIHIPDVGLVLFERSSRARHVNITIRPFKNVRVAVPSGMSLKEAQKIVMTKLEWIKKTLIKIKKIENDTVEKPHQRGHTDNLSARRLLIQRLSDFAREYGFKYNRVFIRRQKTLWGSCSSKNNINLNIRLTELPEKLRDYVILHELVHTKIKNHKKEFWNEMQRIIKNAKDLHSELKRYHLSL